jgi:prepilin-type N-terminal cleavage/methylation domain-containing protein
MRQAAPSESGFSMVELLVAMTVTLIISGAIFGLLTGGQNAFRREPAMTDRQQTIRVAMDLIKRDVAGAGAQMAPFVRAFTPGLDGAGGAPSSTQTAGSISNTATDVLEILTATGQCPGVVLTAASGSQLTSAETQPTCFPDSAATRTFFYVGSTSAAEVNNYGVELGRSNSAAGTNGFNIDLLASGNLNPVAPNPAAGFCGTANCRMALPVDVVRYEVAPDPEDGNVPALWRSQTGAYTAAGAGPFAPGSSRPNWEVVARGIEDFQVRYLTGGSGGFVSDPGTPFCTAPCNPVQPADLNLIVKQVEVRLSARAITGGPIQGGTTAAAGSNAGTAIRGQLVAVITPRAALTALGINPTATNRWY